MRKQITLAVPEAVYEQAISIADATQQPLDKVFEDALEQVFSPFPLHEKHDEMAQEAEAYKAMHAGLVDIYLGQYVAVFQGKVIDHDEDVVALSRRINEKLPDEVVLIRKVKQNAERILNMRSPRFLSRK
jgi:hypothetical protein